MKEFLVTAGTHIGIVGCYGEKKFKANNEQELFKEVTADLFKDEEDHSKQLRWYFGRDGRITWFFADDFECTLYEFYYEQLSL